MTMSSRHRSNPRYKTTEQEKEYETANGLSQPNVRELLELLSTKLPNLVRNAKHELSEGRSPNIKAEEAKHLKKELNEAQNRIDELEEKLLQKDKGLNSHKPTVTNLQNRLDHEKRSKDEIDKKFQDASKLVEKLKKEVQTAETETRWAKTGLKNREEELKKTKNELDDARTRLSKSMGDKLTDNNPNIADLSDKNRPTKLAERYQEIYDNEWTDAFETIQQNTGYSEEQTITVLISILMDTLTFCQKQADSHMDEIENTVSKDLPSVGGRIPQNVKKYLKDCRKAVAEVSAKHFYKKFEKELNSLRSSTARKAKIIPKFVEACFTICWLSTVQDPPMVFCPNANKGEPFDTDLYKAYTTSGKRIEFVVWPALLLHRDGPVLCKGIAQGHREASRRSRSAPSRNQKHEYSPEGAPGSYSATVRPVHRESSELYHTRDTRESEHIAGYQERGIYTNRYNDDVTPVRSYEQTVPRQSRQAFKPKNLHMYRYEEEDFSQDQDPSQSDIDTFFRYIEMFGYKEAEEILGEKYDICIRYLERLDIN